MYIHFRLWPFHIYFQGRLIVVDWLIGWFALEGVDWSEVWLPTIPTNDLRSRIRSYTGSICLRRRSREGTSAAGHVVQEEHQHIAKRLHSTTDQLTTTGLHGQCRPAIVEVFMSN